MFIYEQIPIPRLSENEMTINYYIDISDYMEDKIEVAKCHESQIKKYQRVGFDVPNRLRVLGLSLEVSKLTVNMQRVFI